MNPKFYAYVGVLFNSPNGAIVKFVTSVDGNQAHWDAGKPAMKFTESFAKEIVVGLTMNYHPSCVIKVPTGTELKNPPAWLD